MARRIGSEISFAALLSLTIWTSLILDCDGRLVNLRLLPSVLVKACATYGYSLFGAGRGLRWTDSKTGDKPFSSRRVTHEGSLLPRGLLLIAPLALALCECYAFDSFHPPGKTGTNLNSWPSARFGTLWGSPLGMKTTPCSMSAFLSPIFNPALPPGKQ